MAKDTVKLISAEGFEFIVDYQAACVSTTIKNMLSSSGMARWLFIRPRDVQYTETDGAYQGVYRRQSWVN